MGLFVMLCYSIYVCVCASMFPIHLVGYSFEEFVINLVCQNTHTHTHTQIAVHGLTPETKALQI